MTLPRRTIDRLDDSPPSGACDCHVHVFGPTDRYPLSADRPSDRNYEVPPLGAADYADDAERAGLDRVVLVQPNAYGTDHRCLVDALQALGERALGVAVLPLTTELPALRALDAAGVRGVRFHELGEEQLALLPAWAEMLAILRWHVEFYAPLPWVVRHASLLARLPCPVVLDHFGGLSTVRDGDGERALTALVPLLTHGPAWLKLSAPYRATAAAAPYADLACCAALLTKAAPHRLLWGSDWPYLRVAPPQPALGELLHVLAGWLGSDSLSQAVLVDNPAELYGFDPRRKT